MSDDVEYRAWRPYKHNMDNEKVYAIHYNPDYLYSEIFGPGDIEINGQKYHTTEAVYLAGGEKKYIATIRPTEWLIRSDSGRTHSIREKQFQEDFSLVAEEVSSSGIVLPDEPAKAVPETPAKELYLRYRKTSADNAKKAAEALQDAADPPPGSSFGSLDASLTNALQYLIESFSDLNKAHAIAEVVDEQKRRGME